MSEINQKASELLICIKNPKNSEAQNPIKPPKPSGLGFFKKPEFF